MRRRVLRPLATCPPELLAYYLGDCQACDRPMVRGRIREPGLSNWFVRSNNAETCRACYAKEWEAQAPERSRNARRIAAANRARDVPFDLIRHLRASVGACVDCGWAFQPAEDDEPGSGPHVCDTDDLELRGTA